MLDFTLGVISLIREYFVSDKRWLLLLAVSAGLHAKSRPGLVPVWRVSAARFYLGFCARLINVSIQFTSQSITMLPSVSTLLGPSVKGGLDVVSVLII